MICMSFEKYLESKPFFEITKYSRHPDYSKDNVAFTGSPRKHPYDKKKLLLISDPFSTNTSEEGDIVKLVKIWVKKGSLGLKYEPFIVEDTVSYLKDSGTFHRPK